MSFDVTTTLRSVQTHLLQNGYFDGGVTIGEPKAPPSGRFAAALIMRERHPAYLTLATTVEVHMVLLRIYTPAEQDPIEGMELALATAVDKVWGDLVGEFDLGGTLQAIDVGGMFGTGISCNWGYQDVSDTKYRVADITLPLIVNDVANLVA